MCLHKGWLTPEDTRYDYCFVEPAAVTDPVRRLPAACASSCTDSYFQQIEAVLGIAVAVLDES